MNPAELPRQNPFLIYWRKIGGGSLLLSLVIHAVLILGAVLLIRDSLVERPVEFITGGGSRQAADASHDLTRTVQIKTYNRINQKIRRGQIISTKPDTEVQVGRIPLDDVSIPNTDDMLAGKSRAYGFGMFGDGGGWSKSANIRGLDGVTLKAPSLASRCGDANRITKIIQNGGTTRCESAVSAAIEWLKTQQNKDGSWGRQHRGAMTGLALLCYLGRCELPDSPFYGPQVEQGLLYLIELGARNEYGIFSEKPDDNSASYEHGLATYALGEMYAMARLGQNSLPRMREAFEKGVRAIIDHQLPDGGWGYGVGFCYRKSGTGDLSVTGWQFQALKAAKYSGLTIPDLHKSIDRAVKYLVSKQTKDGGFGNANREQGYNQWNLTGAGVLGLQTLGDGRHPNEIRKGVKFARNFFTKEPPRWDTNASLYAWYYYAQAFFQNGGDAWKQWNDAALGELLAHQNKDGSWQNENSGSSVASTKSAGADRAIYRTTLCTLMLEVYYRYLKVGDREERSVFER